MNRLLPIVPLVIGLSIGCAASSRQRVVSAGPVDTGPDSLVEARKQLEGRWALVSMQVAGEDDGKLVDVEATGTMVADAFGSVAIEFTMTDAGQKALASLGIKSPNPRISTSGQTAINARAREITFVGNKFTTSGGMDAETAKRRQNPFALERIRYYSFDEQGVMTLSTRYNNGKDAVVGKWKRTS